MYQFGGIAAVGLAIFNAIATGCRWTILSTASKVAGLYPAVTSGLGILILFIVANSDNGDSSSYEPYDDCWIDCKNQTGFR
jgi:hypothetical protein